MDTTEVDMTNGPHSRACGLRCKGHGIECHRDCPTCHGGNPDLPRTRRARLEVKAGSENPEGLATKVHFLGFEASNGEPLGESETHPNKWATERSREAWITAMIQVLQQEGYTVSKGPRLS